MLRDTLLFGAGAFLAWLFLREPYREDHFKAARDHLEKVKEFTSKGFKNDAWLNKREAEAHMKLLSEGERVLLKQEFGVV